MKFKEFVTPIGARYFEDYEADCTYDCGQRLVLESEIIEFAQRYAHLEKASLPPLE